MTIVRLGKSGLPNLLMNNLAIAGFRDIPTMSLDFTDPSDSLVGTVTFTRASAGTRVNKLGLIESRTNDQPRFDYDPVTLSARGLLIEEQRTNLLINSIDFSTGWSKNRSSVSASGTFLGQTSYKLTEDSTASNTHYVTQSVTKTATAITYTGVVLVKGGERGFCDLVLGNSTLSAYQVWKFDLSTGVNSTSGAIGFTAGSGYSVNMGSGIWLCVITATSDTDTGIRFDVRINNSYGNPNYNGDGVSGIYIGCPQLEAGAFPTSYIPTTSAAVTRAADVASMTGTNFSSWFNATEGTFVEQHWQTQTGAVAQPFTVSDGTLNNRIQCQANTVRNTGIVYRYNATNADTAATTTVGAGVPIKTAIGYSTSAVLSVTQNGSAIVNSPTAGAWGTIPDRLNIGANPAPVVSNICVQRLTYYNKRLPDATIKALST